MTGKLYYITTIGDWKRYAELLTNSHWIALDGGPSQTAGVRSGDVADAAKILVLVETDEGMHGALEDDPAFEALPHPLSPKPISDTARRALWQHRFPEAASTFDAIEVLGQLHPLLKARVF